MTQRERQGWIIVASLFVTLVFVFGSGYNTGGLFFPHLLNISDGRAHRSRRYRAPRCRCPQDSALR